MSLDGRRRYGAIEFERHDNHEKTIQLYPGTVRVREAFVLRSIEVHPLFNDLVASFMRFDSLLRPNRNPTGQDNRRFKCIRVLHV